MAAYCLFDNLEVLDAAKLETYASKVRPVVQQFGGRYVVIGGKVDLMEGTEKPVYPVMIEFPSLADAHRWYDSEEYRDLKALRFEAGRFNAFFVEGL